MDNRLQQNLQEIFSIYFSLKVTSHVFKIEKIAVRLQPESIYRSLPIQTWSLFFECTFEKLFYENSVSTVNCILEDLLVRVTVQCHSKNLVLKLCIRCWEIKLRANSFPPCYSVTSTALPRDFYFFKLTQPLTVSTVQLQEKGGKIERKPYPLPMV